MKLIKVKKTEKTLGHTNVICKNILKGYFIKNDSSNSVVDENWNFVSDDTKFKHFHTRTKKIMVSKLNSMFT